MTRQRFKRLTERYGDLDIVQSISARRIWVGMTRQQLVDSWGMPEAVDTDVERHMVLQVYKYGQLEKDRFRHNVRVKDGTVTGWSQEDPPA
jgi:hypothetical protein